MLTLAHTTYVVLVCKYLFNCMYMFPCQLILLFCFLLSKLRHFSYFSVNNECKKEKIFLLCKIIGCPIVCCCRKSRSKTERRNVQIYILSLLINDKRREENCKMRPPD